MSLDFILFIFIGRPGRLLSPKKNGPRYERLGGSGELIFSVIPAAVFEPLAAHCVIG